MKITDINTMLAIAINLKPKNRQRTKETRAETLDILAKMSNEAQTALLEYECLKEVLRGHPDREQIITDAKLLFEEKVKGINTIHMYSCL